METADKQARNIEGMKELKINKVAGRKERQVVKKPDHGYMHNGKQAAKPEKLCFRCGNKGHFGKDLTCPAKDKLCNKCGREGHFAICCKTRVPQARKQGKGKPRVRHVEEQSGEDEFAFSVSGFADNNNQITVKVGGVNINMLIDSGASCNIIDKQMWTNLKDKKIKCKSEKTVRKIDAYGNPKPLPILGVFYADVITRKRQKENVEFIVIDGKGEALLGRKTATELGLLKIYTDDSVNTVYLTTTDLEGAYPEVFDGVGTLIDHQIKIHIDLGVKPVVQGLRRIPFSLKIRTKLPEIYGVDIETDTDVRDRDAEEKGKGKLYADKRRNATESTVKVGDDVLLKQQKRDKFTTTFESEPYKVVDKRGNNVTTESSTGVQYERNSSHVKPYLSSCEDDNAGEKIVEKETVIEASTDAIQETEKPSRPTREIGLPAKFKDFVMK
ncbi:hypothetical protein FSP39_017183 [Pinctada imbricata]|uniref:CCHC-type domain-containing protein n=1 Tax=Pinctada imbricata TaxID=66713 RepID=A0AA89C4P7_PINIB|nr:hypothetical protein FSP39_017183 [Pinctada imbricata]